MSTRAPQNRTAGDVGTGHPAPSVDPAEVEKFVAQAEAWWDPDGAQAPLHRINPVRLRYIRDRTARHFGRDPLSPLPLRGLRVLDVGCGGGLVSEPLARLGAQVTGIDAGAETVAAAAVHAEHAGLEIDYRMTTAEALLAGEERYDLVVTLEVVEHVRDPHRFLADCASLVAPGGALAMATLNRTAKSFLMAIVGAEYVLRWLPRGTHDWRRFVRPSEAARALRGGGLQIENLSGLVYDPVTGRWTLSDTDRDVNYMIFAVRR